MHLRFFYSRRCEIKNISAIVLAGGRGVRMQSDLPKVLHPLCEKPLIEYVVNSLNSADVNEIVVVVGYRGDEVVNFLGGRVDYVWQHEQLGTGHAVMQAEDYYRNFPGYVIVTCGDVPLLMPETFQALVRDINDKNAGAVVLTMNMDNPKGYGRIVREDDSFSRIVEEKDANDIQREISEVNSGTYIFRSDLLFSSLKEINTENAQGEYYLPDALLAIAKSGHRVITSLLENSVEATGVNTRDELIKLEEYVKKCEEL